jgi:hypothetical protein
MSVTTPENFAQNATLGYNSPLLSNSTSPTRQEDNSNLLNFLGSIGGAGAAGLAAYYGKKTGQEDLRDIAGGLTQNYADVRSGVQTGGEFKPYTVTSGAGGASFDNGQMTLDPNAAQQGLTNQANTMLGGLSTGVTGLGNLGGDAFAQANQAMYANSGMGASQLGGMYGQMGQQQINAAQSPAELQRLQTAMTTQGLTASGQPSQGLLGLQNLAGQANFNGGSADVTGAFSGISAPNVNNVAGGIGQQATQNMNFGAQAQNVQGAFAGIEAPSVRTGSGEFGSGLLAQAQQALQGETPTAQGLFEQIRATQQPEEERQRIALENRLAAQGRLGVSTAAYGGTPEQLAMEKAQAEARNNASYQAIQQADQLATSQQARAAQLGQMGLSAEQVQAQLDSEGFGQQMQLGQSRLSEAQTQEALQSSVQQRQAQLAQLGLSAQQIQAQLESEGFSQQMQLGQANIGAQQAQSQLDSESQNRASQLAQLGMSAEQIASQLQSEGLSRQQSSAQLASQIAQTGAGISAQQQQLGQSMLGLGLQSQELGGQLNMQDLARAQGMFGMGQQSAMMPSQLQGAEIANIGNLLQSSNIPYQQQLAAAQMGLGAQQSEADRQMQLTNLLANVGLSEAGLIRDLGLGESTLTQEYIKSLGNIGAGVAGIDF